MSAANITAQKNYRTSLLHIDYTRKLAEIVSHLLSLYSGTMYPAQASAHPPL